LRKKVKNNEKTGFSISLFQDLKDSTLNIANLQHFFARCQKAYQEAHRETDPKVARQKSKAFTNSSAPRLFPKSPCAAPATTFNQAVRSQSKLA